jgi:hypothetical protein
MKDIISAKGEVHLCIWNKDGELLEEIKGDNLIVNIGKQSLALLLGDADSDKRVSQVGFGTSGATTAGGDTSLQSPLVKALDGVTYSGSAAIFEYALELNEYNGNTIREFGLYTQDSTLFSRITRQPIVKTNEIRLTGTWKITF